MPTNGDLTVQQYDVQPGLGRHMVLDPRSMAYRRPYTGQLINPVEWAPKVPVLNQQDLIAQGIRTSELFPGVDDVDALGSCTANATTAALSVLLDADACAAAGLNLADPIAAERFAIQLYADATQRDEWLDSTWPSDDCGSSGLGVAKALRVRGLIDQYGHATTAEELCTLLQTGPVLMGLPWLAAFGGAGPDGFIDADPNWATSPVEGGHEVCVTALETVGIDDGTLLPDQTVIRFRNSWTSSWADNGEGRLRLSTYQALQDQIDVIQPRIDGASL